MAYTTAAELDAVRATIQSIHATGRSLASFSVDGQAMSYEGTAAQLPALEHREETLMRRLSYRNMRKRTASDFSGTTGDDD